MLREAVETFLDFLIGHFDLWSLKGRLSYQDCIKHNTQRPNVNLVRVSDLVSQHLWSEVVWCPAHCMTFFSVKLEFCSQTEVSEFYFQILVKKKITQFEVSVDDFIFVEILQGLYNLKDVVLGL